MLHGASHLRLAAGTVSLPMPPTSLLAASLGAGSHASLTLCTRQCVLSADARPALLCTEALRCLLVKANLNALHGLKQPF